MFIHATSGIPRLLFDVKTDQIMKAKFEKSTIDVFLVQDRTHLYIMEVLRFWMFLKQDQTTFWFEHGVSSIFRYETSG
jgi:lysyl-tRNA synthetase class I